MGSGDVDGQIRDTSLLATTRARYTHVSISFVPRWLIVSFLSVTRVSVNDGGEMVKGSRSFTARQVAL